MSDSIDLLLRILLDKSSIKETEDGIDSVASSFSEIEKEAKKIESAAKKFGIPLSKTFKELKKNGYDSGQAVKRLSAEFDNGKGKLKGYVDEQTKLKNETASTIKVLREQEAVLSKKSSVAGRVSGALGTFGTQSIVAGTAIGVGILAEATAYATKMEDATEGTRKFNEELRKIQSARGRIDEVLVSAVTPILQTASKIANITAGIIEKNPQLVSFALKGAAVLVAVGALAKVASAGFKIYADLTYFTAQGIGLKAAQMQLAASNNQLLAAGAKGAVGVVAGGAAASIAVTVATVLAVIAAGAVIGVIIYDLIAKLAPQLGLPRFGAVAAGGANLAGQQMEKIAVAGGMDEKEAQRKTLVFTYLIGRIFGSIKEGEPAWKSVVDGAKAATGALSTLGSVAEDEAAAIKMMTDLAQDNAKAERKFANDRADIYTNAERSLADTNRRLSTNLSSISSALSSNVGKINSNLKTTLADLATNFADANIKAESEYQSQRASIIASGAEEIKKIQIQKQKDLENLERDHNRNVASLTAERDALGLVLENNSYAEKKSEIEQSASEATAQARANTQAQLAEAARNYEEQRAQRYAEYQQQKEEAKAKATADKAEAEAQAAEDRKRAIDAAAAERAEILRKRAEALADLKKAYDRERSERVTAVYNEITELRGALNAEMLMRRTYQNQILADATSHMKAMAAAQGSKTTPSHDYSGYAYQGVYAMAKNGQREYVLSGAATRAAEQMVGGQLNQQVLLAGLAGQRGGNSMQYVDQSQYSGMTVADVRKVRQISRQESLSTLKDLYRK